MEIKIIELNLTKDNVLIVNETKEYDNIMSMSKTGGIRFNFAKLNTNYKDKWITPSKFNNYEVIDFGKKKFMFFTEKYNKKEVINAFALTYISILTADIESKTKSLEFWKTQINIENETF